MVEWHTGEVTHGRFGPRTVFLHTRPYPDPSQGPGPCTGAIARASTRSTVLRRLALVPRSARGWARAAQDLCKGPEPALAVPRISNAGPTCEPLPPARSSARSHMPLPIDLVKVGQAGFGPDSSPGLGQCFGHAILVGQTRAGRIFMVRFRGGRRHFLDWGAELPGPQSSTLHAFWGLRGVLPQREPTGRGGDCTGAPRGLSGSHRKRG